MLLEKSVDSKNTKTYINLRDYKKLALGVLFITVAFLITLFSAYPFYTNYQNNKKLIEAEKVKLQQLDLRLAQLDKIKKIATTINSSTNVALQAVPEVSEIPVVMNMVQEIAKRSGVKINTFSYAGMGNTVNVPIANSLPQDPTTTTSNDINDQTNSATSPKNDYNNFSMQLTVAGSFDDIKRLIINLEESRRILDVKSFNYSVNTNETEIIGNTITLKVNLLSYFKLFTPLAVDINLEQYAPLLKKLNELKYTEIDLSNSTVGKIDPFNSQNNSDSLVTPTPNQFVEINNANPGTFFNNDATNIPIDIIELEGTGSTQTNQQEEPIEAEEGDTTKLLQDLLKQEGL